MNYKVRLLIFIIIALWLTGIFYEWFLSLNNFFIIAFPFVKRTYSLVCHQDPQKLIEFYNHKTLVCARCLGIYSGVFILSFISLFKNFTKLPSIKVLISIIFITLFDVLATTFGLYNYSKLIAFTTGLLLGSMAFLYFYFAMINLFKEIKEKI